jgi:integrase/recombinase XerD
MRTLAKAVHDYVALRRALGFKMVEVSHRLDDFVRFARRERASRVTVDLAVRWAKLPTTVQPATWATRLGIVRHFAEYLHTIDPSTEIPPRGLLPGKYQRKPPYRYGDAEIQRLLQAARTMRSPTGLRAWTYATLLGLLTVTGVADQRGARARPARRRPP